MDPSDLVMLGENVTEVLAERCDSAALHAFLDGKRDLGTDVMRLAAELGWLLVAVPEDVGGLGGGPAGVDLLHRALGRYAAPGALGTTLIALQWLAGRDRGDSAAAMLPTLMAGELAAAIPLDFTPLSLRGGAVAGGPISIVGWTNDGLALVPCVDGDEPAIALVRIDGSRARVEPLPAWDRTRTVGELRCDGAPAAGIAWGAPAVAALKVCILLATASDSVGGSAELLDRTVAYMKERVQFGRAIASFQALKHRVADMAVARATCEQLLDTALEAGGTDEQALWAHLAGAEAGEAYARTAAECLLLFGGVGFTWEYDPHIYVKRARLNGLLGGNGRTLRDAAIGLMSARLASGEGR